MDEEQQQELTPEEYTKRFVITGAFGIIVCVIAVIIAVFVGMAIAIISVLAHNNAPHEGSPYYENSSIIQGLEQ